MSRFYPILLVAFLMVACNKQAKDKGFDENNLIKPVDYGAYHSLPDDGIKIFLPEGFKKLTVSDITGFLDSVPNEKMREYLKKSYRLRKFMPGNYYDFFNEEYFGEAVVTTMKYMPFDRSTAGQLLFYLRMSHEKEQKITGIGYEKLKSTYMGNENMSIFKAIYKLEYPDSTKVKFRNELEDIYNTIYVISAGSKTFTINITVPFEADFDPFIKRIKL